MPATQERIPAAYASPTGWIKLNARGRTFYADPNMLMDANSEPLTDINFYKGHLALQRLGIRSIDNIEFNELVDTDPQAAKQMRKYAVWTSFLRDVEKASKKGGYKAKHIARPFVKAKDGTYNVEGSEKTIKLPDEGYFKISHILQSEDGLPHETFSNPPHEPWAYFYIKKGPERPVLRGLWSLREHRRFSASAHWKPFDSRPLTGVRGASNSEPKLVSPKVQLARTGMLCILDSLEGNYTDAQKIEALRAAIEGL